MNDRDDVEEKSSIRASMRGIAGTSSARSFVEVGVRQKQLFRGSGGARDANRACYINKTRKYCLEILIRINLVSSLALNL